jgi:hypothetical protein
MAHKALIVGSSTACQVKCSCKLRSPLFPSRWEAEDWREKHLLEAERAAVHHFGPLVSMERQAAYFEERAADPEVSESDRALWVEMARALRHRLGEDGTAEQLELFK